MWWIDVLPAELWLNVFSLLGADATPRDWVTVGQICCQWRETRDDWCTQWMRRQMFGSKFCIFDGTKGDISFLVEQTNSKQTTNRGGSVLSDE
jgi:hypothetical protein